LKRGLIILLFLNLKSFSQETIVFSAKESGYDIFRIPAIIQISENQLMAFAEGRVNGSNDFGNIDIVFKKSNDGGSTWTALSILVDNKKLQAGNPAPVVDNMDPAYPSGVIYLFYNTGNNHEYEVRKGNGVREVWFVKSVDQGITWSSPVNITAQVHRPNNPSYNSIYQHLEDWRSYANTPGHAIQLKYGKYAGRIFIPANHSYGNPQDGFLDYRAHAFYSDDHGKTFQLSSNIDIPGSNESTAAEITNGKVLMNIRNQHGNPRKRILAVSSNDGLNWDRSYFSNELIDPVCQGSMLNITYHRKKYLLFSNLHATNTRDSLRIKFSIDDGITWKNSVFIETAPSNYKGDWAAYSDLVEINKQSIGILYERKNYTEIVFKKLERKKIIN
jgi:sialidase-1